MAGSSASSPAGSSAADLVADAGPAFDPKAAPAAPEAELEQSGPEDEWDERRVREILTMGGETLHWALAVKDAGDEETWLATERDLNAIVPPATRIANRYDVIRAAAAAGDEAILAAAMTRYTIRNYTKRKRYLARLAAQEPQPITGRAAEPGTGPEDDPDWQGMQPEALAELPLEPPPALTPKGAHVR